MVGARDVVPERGRARRPDEQAAGRTDHRGERLHLRADQLQVLGGERVCERHGLARLRDLHERERRLADGRALDDEGLERSGELITEVPAERDRDDKAALAVLPLREHVERRQFNLLLARLRPEKDEQIAGTGEPVDPHRRGEQSLGLLHVQVPRADHDVDAIDRLGAVRERSDRLRPAHAVHALDAAQPADAEDRRVDLPVSARRSAHRDVQHAGGARGHHAHHDRARVGRPPAGDVHRRRADRHLAQRDPLPLGQLDRDVLADARLGHHGDVCDRHLQPRHELEREQLDRLVELLRADQQRLGLGAGGVEPARVVADGLIALSPDLLDDLAHRRLHGGAVGHERAQVGGGRGGTAQTGHLLGVEALDPHLRRRLRRAGRAAAPAARRSGPP